VPERIDTRAARWFVFKPKMGKFWRVLQWKMMVYFMDTWSILRSFCYILCTFGTVRGNLVYFPRFGILYREKSGSPDRCIISSRQCLLNLHIPKINRKTLARPPTHIWTLNTNRFWCLCLQSINVRLGDRGTIF
jgi:hypothetical protein